MLRCLGPKPESQAHTQRRAHCSEHKPWPDMRFIARDTAASPSLVEPFVFPRPLHRPLRPRAIDYHQHVKFVCRLREHGGVWTAEHKGPDVGPIKVTAPSRDEALRKLEDEIGYWLEMCPCSGQTYHHIEIELAD